MNDSPPAGDVDAFAISAELVKDTIMGRVDELIYQKHLERMRIPTGVKITLSVFDHSVQSVGMAYDARKDDFVLSEELRDDEAGQAAACNEFMPPKKDRLAGMDKVI